MADPLEQLSDSDLEALSKNDLESMSDQGLKIVASSNQTPAKPADEPLGHKIIREGLPLVGQVVGGLGAGAVATPETLGAGTISAAMAGAAAGNVAGNEAAGWLNHEVYGDEAPTYDSAADAERLGLNAAVGASAELGGQLIGKGVKAAAASTYIKPYLDEAGNLIVNGFNKLGQYVGSSAENLALKATGATGAQSMKYAPGTGRMLLDKGIVRFGRSQEGIANAASDALEDTGTKIGDIVQDLTNQGATTTKQDLLAGIQGKIEELGNDPAQVQVVNQLNQIKEAVAAGPETPNLSQVETTKQGFQGMVNWANPEGNAAKAAAADVYKDAGEAAAAQTDYKTAKNFVDAKKLYGQLRPVADFSARRAAHLNQSPLGGFLDVTSAAAGAATGGPAVAVGAPIARRAIAPRITSSLAATADGVSKVLQNTPEFFGRWTPVLSNAVARGEMSLNASVYLLQQQDPEFRQKMQELNNGLTQANDDGNP